MAKKLGFCWYLVFILIIVAAGMYLWGYMKVRQMEKTVKEKEVVMVEKAQLMVNESTQELLKVVALPLTWAIRKEMIKGNYEQINDYMERLVQEKGFKEILLVDPQGVIVLATDKKLQGQKFADYYPAEILEVDDVTVSADANIIRVATPVMGINAKLGVLVFTYTPGKVSAE
ncbi:MAG: hypothetical protein QMD82_05515 [bacterium]|nr:hypothetical protein [bacterium]